MGGRGGSGPSKQRMGADFEALHREQSTMGVEQEIQRAYNKLFQQGAGAFGGPSVYLDDLRTELATRGITDRARVDAALEGLARRHIASLLPLEPAETSASALHLSAARQKALREAGVRSGGQEKHKIRIG